MNLGGFEFKRPSMFTIYIIVAIILVTISIVSIFINVSVNKKREKATTDLENVDSIAGEENVVTDGSGNKINSSNKTVFKKDVDGFVFDSFDIKSADAISTVTFEIYNPSNEEKTLGEYELKVLNENSDIIGRITDNAGTFEPLARREVSLQIKGDISNLTDIQINKIVYKPI